MLYTLTRCISILTLAREHASGKTVPGLPEKLIVSERKITMTEIIQAEKDETLFEVFGAGTAAIVSAVDKSVCLLLFSDYADWGGRRIGYQGRDISIPTGPEGLGQIAKGMLDRVQAIQTGEFEHEWSVVANEA
jgi:branched-chain amino acid aminotransferase